MSVEKTLLELAAENEVNRIPDQMPFSFWDDPIFASCPEDYLTTEEFDKVKCGVNDNCMNDNSKNSREECARCWNIKIKSI